MTTTPHPPDLDALARQLAADTPIALLDNNLDAAGRSWLFTGLDRALVAWHPGEIGDTFAALDALAREGARILLAADYELGYALERRLAPCLPATGRPLLRAWAWKNAAALTHEETDALLPLALAALPAERRTAGLAELSPALDAVAHRTAIERIRALIVAGDCYQVNFTFPYRAQSYGDPLALYARLREAQAVRYGAFVRHAGGAILSRSPELFFARQGARLHARPMKGTAALGEAAALAASEKDRAENLMIVDLVRSDLGRLAPSGGVRVERLFEIEDYATLHQMTSTIVAEPVTASLSELLRALFPCGSVTGAPKIRAMEIIRELEPEPRGLYCGALGWVGGGGDLCLNVPIRTLEIDIAGAVRLGIGSGIVADSQPAAEWAECQAKARFMSQLAPEFELFETLRLEGGRFPLIERHLARLARSAAAFGFRYDPAVARVALAGCAAAQRGQAPRRVRLALAADGSLTLMHAPLDPLPPAPTVTLARQPQDAGNPLCAHKTSLRARYDEELACASAAGHFDALFFNRAGQLCEGARSNVFLRIGGALVTPPLRCGLLPGVLREALLEAGHATEGVLAHGDLARAEALYVGNALRGLVAVRLAA